MQFAVFRIIIVRGSVDDWKKIRQRVEIISQYELDWWTKRLLPICDSIIETVAGKPSLEFWQHICKPKAIYGGEVITGWIADLFPYINSRITKTPTIKNPILAIPRQELTIDDGISTEAFPNGISQASFRLNTRDGESQLELVAGFIGVCQNQQTGCLHPEIGWGVRNQDDFVRILNKLEKEHQLNLPIDEYIHKRTSLELPAELIQILERFDGGTLFADTAHPWNIKSLQDYRRCKIAEINRFFTSFINLKDNRCIAFGNVRRKTGNWGDENYQTWFEWWIVVGTVLVEDEGLFKQKTWILKPESTKVIAKGILQFFERMIQADGKYYFDADDFIADESLVDSNQ